VRVVVEADGGSRGNPGPAGYGAVVKDADSGEVLAEAAAGIGVATNNVAEYEGLIAGLRAAADLAPAAVEVRMDSKLVVEQMSGRWKVKHPSLAPLASTAAELARSLPSVRYKWVPRASNAHADRLANEAMDAAAAGRAWLPRAGREPPTEPAQGGAPGTAHGTAPGTAHGSAVGTAHGWTLRTGTPVTVLLVRHGQTAHSVDRRFSGRADPPLTDLGQAQAAALADRLARWPRPIDAIVASPLARARSTAGAVAAKLGLEVSIVDGLVETDFGDWDGLTMAEVRDRWPAEFAAWRDSDDVAPPGGESMTTVARRVRRARDTLLAGHPGQVVVAVTHVTPIKLLLRQALDASAAFLYRLHLDLAGLSIVDWYPDGTPSVRLVNDTSHVAQL
jgi:ribonuclease H / adenosylcobalamin/alpha-ribazole phosphatase